MPIYICNTYIPQTFSGHTGPVYAVAINPKDPTQMLTGGGDDRAFLWTASNLIQGVPPPAPSADGKCMYVQAQT